MSLSVSLQSAVLAVYTLSIETFAVCLCAKGVYITGSVHLIHADISSFLLLKSTKKSLSKLLEKRTKSHQSNNKNFTVKTKC